MPMLSRYDTRPRSLADLIGRTKVPANTVGIFWPGGCSMVFKSVQQKVYLFDPVATLWAAASRAGGVDIRPDLVFSSVAPGDTFDFATLCALATAFPDVQFAGSSKCCDVLIGRTDILADVMPIAPWRVQALEQGLHFDVRSAGVPDGLRIRVLAPSNKLPEPPWNLSLHFSKVQIAWVQNLVDAEHVDEIAHAVRQRVDVLLCSCANLNMVLAMQLVERLKPGYAIPFAHDCLDNGREIARSFREGVGQIPGVKSYLFADDYMEGLLYSRLMSRKSR